MAESTTGQSIVGQETGRESSLSNWAGPYVTSMLGKGAALSNENYQGYSGPLTAGQSNLQNQAFQGIAGLTVPTEQMGNYQPQSFTQEGTAQQYMNPYVNAALQPQLDELRRQSEMSRVQQAGRLTQAGAYGGSRQALADVELSRAMWQMLRVKDTIKRINKRKDSSTQNNSKDSSRKTLQINLDYKR